MGVERFVAECTMMSTMWEMTWRWASTSVVARTVPGTGHRKANSMGLVELVAGMEKARRVVISERLGAKVTDLWGASFCSVRIVDTSSCESIGFVGVVVCGASVTVYTTSFDLRRLKELSSVAVSCMLALAVVMIVEMLWSIVVSSLKS